MKPSAARTLLLLYFGTTKINNNFDIVDAVGKEDGKGMTATLFARGGGRIYSRLNECAKTRRQWPSGWHSFGRTGALRRPKRAKRTYGEVPILGTPYITGYEPIKDGSGAQIGVYYVGYKK